MAYPDLVVTFRKGRPLAAYYHFDGCVGRKSYRSREVEAGLVVDFARNGDPIGLEIVSPRYVTLAAMNRVLKGIGLPPLKAADIAPLRAAS